jgi:hypothetical protein
MQARFIPIPELATHKSMTAIIQTFTFDGYIAACSDPIALELDEFCHTIGGHIHVATVTPDHGFRWVPGLGPI